MMGGIRHPIGKRDGLQTGPDDFVDTEESPVQGGMHPRAQEPRVPGPQRWMPDHIKGKAGTHKAVGVPKPGQLDGSFPEVGGLSAQPDNAAQTQQTAAQEAIGATKEKIALYVQPRVGNAEETEKIPVPEGFHQSSTLSVNLFAAIMNRVLEIGQEGIGVTKGRHAIIN